MGSPPVPGGGTPAAGVPGPGLLRAAVGGGSGPGGSAGGEGVLPLRNQADLGPWIASRYGAPDPAVGRDPASDWEATGWAAADDALRSLIPAAPPGMGQEYGEWLARHVAAHRRRGCPFSWQWNLTTWGWILFRAGIIDLRETEHGRYTRVLQLVGFIQR